MTRKYRLIFLGLNDNPETFTKVMSNFGVSEETAKELILKAPVIIKKDISLRKARKYADAIQLAGGSITIKEDGWANESDQLVPSISAVSFNQFTMCPECGLKQPKKDSCVKCGFSFNNNKVRSPDDVASS